MIALSRAGHINAAIFTVLIAVALFTLLLGVATRPGRKIAAAALLALLITLTSAAVATYTVPANPDHVHAEMRYYGAPVAFAFAATDGDTVAEQLVAAYDYSREGQLPIVFGHVAIYELLLSWSRGSSRRWSWYSSVPASATTGWRRPANRRPAGADDRTRGRGARDDQPRGVVLDARGVRACCRPRDFPRPPGRRGRRGGVRMEATPRASPPPLNASA